MQQKTEANASVFCLILFFSNLFIFSSFYSIIILLVKILGGFSMWYIWLIIAGICFVIEMITVGFFVFWFGIGALITMLVSLICPGNLWLQSIV